MDIEVCDSDLLRGLLEERDKNEKLPFENLIYTSKKNKIKFIIKYFSKRICF